MSSVASGFLLIIWNVGITQLSLMGTFIMFKQGFVMDFLRRLVQIQFQTQLIKFQVINFPYLLDQIFLKENQIQITKNILRLDQSDQPFADSLSFLANKKYQTFKKTLIKKMSLQIIVQDIKLFGKVLPKNTYKQNQPIEQQRRFRVTIGDKTFIAKNSGFFLTQSQLVFDEPFSFFYDNHSINLFIEIFPQHQPFDNSDLQQTLFAEFDLSDISSMIGERIQTTFYNFHDQAVGKLTASIEVFKKGPKFIEKVTSQVLFQTVREQKQRQIKASAASKNIKNLMVNNSLTNTLMTVNYLQVKPQKQDPEIFNRESFILIRYSPAKAYSKIIKVSSKQNVIWTDYMEFMKNEDVKFEFYFMFYDDLGSIVVKAKGEIKYIVFDQTINNHTIVLFDRRSNIYGNLMVKFIQKQVDVVNILNKTDKRLKQEQPQIIQSIQQFNRYRFESKNNKRILSQKLRQMQLRALQQQEQKSKPLDQQQKKKKEQDGRFIQFLQRQVIKIQRELKKRQVQQKRDERRSIYQGSGLGGEKKDKKMNVSMRQGEGQGMGMGLERIEEIDEGEIVVRENGKMGG